MEAAVKQEIHYVTQAGSVAGRNGKGYVMLMVECLACHKKHFTEEGRSPDRALECACCPVEHDHGRAANESGKPCRPIEITVLPGSASLSVM